MSSTIPTRKIPSRPLRQVYVSPDRDFSIEARAARNAVMASSTVKSLHKGSYGPATTKAMPKEETGRNATVLEMAQERECLLKIPAACTGYRSTVVACHQNEGKGMGLKQSDARSVWGCFACHMAYDASGMKRSAKRAIFAAAHARQMDEWQKIANDQSEPERYRRAARWAIQWNGMTFSEAVEAAERAKI